MPLRPCLRLLRAAALPAVGLVLLAAAGCTDEDPVAPADEPFAIHVRVTTDKGEPVAGLRGALSPDLGPGVVRWPYPEAKDLPPGTVLVRRVYDLEGRLLRTLRREDGVTYWDRCDASGTPVHDGVYRHVSESLGPAGEVVVEEYYQYSITGDPAFHAAGVTDDGGRFSVDDRTYVPALYDLPPIEVTTYPDMLLERIEPTLRTRLTLLADDGSYQVFVFDAVDKAQDIAITWNPTPPRATR